MSSGFCVTKITTNGGAMGGGGGGAGLTLFKKIPLYMFIFLLKNKFAILSWLLHF